MFLRASELSIVAQEDGIGVMSQREFTSIIGFVRRLFDQLLAESNRLLELSRGGIPFAKPFVETSDAIVPVSTRRQRLEVVVIMERDFLPHRQEPVDQGAIRVG